MEYAAHSRYNGGAAVGEIKDEPSRLEQHLQLNEDNIYKIEFCCYNISSIDLIQLK